MRLQVEGLFKSPQLIQFLVENAVDVLLETSVNLENDHSADFIRGVHRGVLLHLNGLVAHIEPEGEL